LAAKFWAQSQQARHVGRPNGQRTALKESHKGGNALRFTGERTRYSAAFRRVPSSWRKPPSTVTFDKED
jgi:hypothetical protein